MTGGKPRSEVADARLAVRLGEVLARVLSRPVEIAGIEPLAGLSNRSYRVRTAAGEYAVKLREPGPGDVLDLVAEAALTRRVAAAGLAPAVLGADPEHGALVTEYRHAAAWSRTAARELRNLRRVATLLGELHRLPVALRRFDCVGSARRYVEAAERGARATSRERRLADELGELAEWFETLPGPAVLCHNDLIADNILDQGRLWLVDFEYAMRAPPILDLASFAAMNRLGPASREVLLRAYYGERERPPAADDFDKVVRLVHLLAFFWARAFALAADDPGRFAEFF